MGPGNDSGPSVPAFLLVSVFHISRLEFEANRMVFRVSRSDIRSNFEPVLCLERASPWALARGVDVDSGWLPIVYSRLA